MKIDDEILYNTVTTKHEIGKTYLSHEEIYLVVQDENNNYFRFVNLNTGIIEGEYSSLDAMDSNNFEDILVETKLVRA
jgi:hypothetical protein